MWGRADAGRRDEGRIPRALQLEVEGEKLVTRHILEQARRNGDDLAAVKARLDRIEETLVGVDLKNLAQNVDALDKKVDGLTKDLPRIVGDEMRKVLRERGETR
jgi:tetrahydromethanopterin S-methyltransferase subunit G